MKPPRWKVIYLLNGQMWMLIAFSFAHPNNELLKAGLIVFSLIYWLCFLFSRWRKERNRIDNYVLFGAPTIFTAWCIGTFF